LCGCFVDVGLGLGCGVVGVVLFSVSFIGGVYLCMAVGCVGGCVCVGCVKEPVWGVVHPQYVA